MADFEATLKWLDMSQYLERFLQAGFDSWSVLCEITEDDLKVLNVDLGHRRKLQKEIARARNFSQSPTSQYPPHQSVPGATGYSTSTSESQPVPVGKRGYRHHPKPDENAPARPYSAYVMFSNHIREEIKGQNIPFTEISRMVGDRWQSLLPAEKDVWKQKAAAPWEKYKQDLSAYQRTDNYRKHEQYVANFNATQAAKKNEGKSWSNSAGIIDGQQQQSLELDSDRTSSLPAMQSIASDQRDGRQAPPIIGGPQEVKASESKLPISRVRAQATASSTTTTRPRVAQACDSCRQRRIKCNGERPVCKPCQDYDIECVYQDGKRDKEKRLTEQLWQKLNIYESLLIDSLPELNSNQQSAIHRAILLPPSPQDANVTSLTKPRVDTNSSDDSHNGESTASGVGSMGSTDHVNYDHVELAGPDMEAAAYVGQASEMSWLQRLGRELTKSPEAAEHISAKAVLSEVKNPFARRPDWRPWPKDMDSSVIGTQLDPYSLPIKNTSDELVKAFFRTVQPAFPILNQNAFLQQYEQLFASPDLNAAKNGVFLALLQVVLAIGAVHAHVTDSDWAGDDRDHLLYFARARLLGTYSAAILSENVSLAQVQLLGLAAVYLISTDQYNRAWSALSIAIRCGQGLGMHLKNVTPSMGEVETLHGIYVWSALVSAERTLSIIVGRPCMVKEYDCSVPSPLPGGNERHSDGISNTRKPRTASFSAFESRSSSSSSARPLERPWSYSLYYTGDQSLSQTYFFHFLELSCLSQRIVEGLYNPHVRQMKWASIQREIKKYDSQLTQWATTLPVQLDVKRRNEHPHSEPLQSALAVLLHSARTIVNRPALCRSERKVQHQSDESIRTSHDAAQRCVESARAILRFLPGESEEAILGQSPIWFTLLHHIKRSATVLLLELAFRAEHMPSKAEEMLIDATKAVNWIHSMGIVSLAARRAAVTLRKFLELAAHKVGGTAAERVVPPPGSYDDSNDFFEKSRQPSMAEAFDLNAWLPMAPNSGAGAIDSNPLHGDLQMSHMDQFGFMRPHEDQPFFPTASEMANLAHQHDEVDNDHHMWQLEGDPSSWFGFESDAPGH